MLSTFNLDANAFITTIVCLATAFVLGSLIGLERQIRQRNAGLCQSSPPANRAMKELGNAHKQVVGRWPTTGWKTATSRCDAESGRCSGSGG